MSVLKRGLRAVLSFGLLCGVASGPAGVAAPLPPDRTVKLDTLAPDAGAKFGDWTVWHIDGDNKAYFFIHDKTRQVIYLTWASNGWVYYRDGNGVWFTVYSQGDPQQQNQGGLPEARYLERKRPNVEVARGTYKFLAWTAKVDGDQMELFVPAVETRIFIRRNSAVFVSNGREIGGR
jgi:hypothetical protein